MEFENANICLKNINLYSLIEEKYMKNESIVSIDDIDYNFKIQKESILKEAFNISIREKSYIIIKPILFNFNKVNKQFFIFCYENFLYLINKYNYNKPYLSLNGMKLHLKMDENNKMMILSQLQEIYDKSIYEDDNLNSLEYMLTEKEFNNNEKIKLKDYHGDEEKVLDFEYFGKYLKDYIGNCKKLIYNSNDIVIKISAELYFENDDNMNNFYFNTGPDKSGKTTFILNQIRFNDYFIYFNLKTLHKLHNNKKYEMFFYEIARYFKNYKDYKTFCESFIKENKLNNWPNFDINNTILTFIESIEKYMKENNDKYKQLMIIIDDFDLDQNNEIIFDLNYNLLKQIYSKRGIKDSQSIRFYIISPLNNNYIKKCVRYGLKIFKKEYNIENELFQIDNNSGILYFAYNYYSNCFYSNDEEYKKYILKVKELNNNKIPEKYLQSLNYSLFHLNNMDLIYEQNLDISQRIIEIDNYIKTIEKKGKDILFSFYENTNKIYNYDLNQVKKYNNLINNEINVDTLLDMIEFIPIELISFQDLIYLKENIIVKNFKVEFLYNIYSKFISQYLDMYTFPDYNEDQSLKPGQKGDCLESKVSEAIKNQYFLNFKPDIIIEINSIFDLTKDKIPLEIIAKFGNISNYNLIMITQKNPCAKRYDLAFLQKINKTKWQLILIQITRRKKNEDMLQYKVVRFDCYKFAQFFNLPEINLEIVKYHFLFIFQGGLEEDTNSMEFCFQNNIKFIKYFVKDNLPIFTDSNNNIINNLIFNDTTHSLVDNIMTYRKVDDTSSNESEYSQLGIKRNKISEISKAKYYLGLNVYEKVKKIIKNDFKLSNETYNLEENLYFHIYDRILKEKKFLYLNYIFNGKKIVVDLNAKYNKSKTEDKKNQGKLKRKINEVGFKIKCFKIVINSF